MERNDIEDIRNGRYISDNAINIIIRMQAPGPNSATRTLMSAGWLNHIEHLRCTSASEAIQLVLSSELAKNVHHGDSWIIPYKINRRSRATGSGVEGHWIYILLTFKGYMWTIGDPGEQVVIGDSDFQNIAALLTFCTQTLNAGGPWEYRKTSVRNIVRMEDSGVHLIQNVLALLSGKSLHSFNPGGLRDYYLDRLSKQRLLPGQIPKPLKEYETPWEPYLQPKPVQLGRFCNLNDPGQKALYKEEILRRANIDLDKEMPRTSPASPVDDLKNHGAFAPHTTDLHAPHARVVMRDMVKRTVDEVKAARRNSSYVEPISSSLLSRNAGPDDRVGSRRAVTSSGSDPSPQPVQQHTTNTTNNNPIYNPVYNIYHEPPAAALASHDSQLGDDPGALQAYQVTDGEEDVL
jgi:hypothetical protein